VLDFLSRPPRMVRSSSAGLGYWPAEQFARSVLGGSSRHGAIAVLVGYFDESGMAPRDKVAMIAGAVADSAAWSALEKPWAKHLASFEKTWYHAVDAEHGEGDFSRTDRPFREAVTNLLSRELAAVPMQMFVSGAYRADWQFASDAVKKRCQDDPYYFAFELCLQQISRWSQDYCDGEPVALVFAEHDQYQERARRLHEFYQRARGLGIAGIGGISFCNPRHLIPLQAADMICYEVHRRFADDPRGNPAVSRRAFQNLEDGGSMSVMIHDRDSLAALRPFKCAT
jgi:hypothetical protein